MSPAAALFMAAACMLSAAGLPLAMAATPPPHTASATASAPAKDEISWVDASVTVEGSVLSAVAEDIDGDGRPEIAMAVYDRALSRREMRIWHLSDDGQLEKQPFLTVSILNDVVAWCWADVRTEPGKELVFLSRVGAWSYSITLDGYRNNLRRLIEVDLLYDVPDPERLPHWEYVLSCAEGDQLLLPELGGYATWGPAPKGDGDGRMIRHSSFKVNPRFVLNVPSHDNRLVISSQGVKVSGSLTGNGLTDLDDGDQLGPLVDAGSRLRSPALVDVNGDGRDDLVRLGNEQLHVHLADEWGIHAEVSSSWSFPPYLHGLDENARVDFDLLDLDGDGDIDLLAKLIDSRNSSLESNRLMSFLVLRNDGSLLPEKPQQIFKFEAVSVVPALADVNGDGRSDLVFSKVTAPSLLEITGPDGLKVTRSVLVFLSTAEGKFDRRPALEQPQTYDETNLGDAVSRRSIGPDCNGDGIGDLIDVNLSGEVRIHRILKQSSFFGGDTWSVDETAWRRLGAHADISAFQTDDLNGDGLADLLSVKGDRMTLLLSRQPGKPR